MQPDASRSRTYLTTKNNPYSQLHAPKTDPEALAAIRVRNEQLKHGRCQARGRSSYRQPRSSLPLLSQDTDQSTDVPGQHRSEMARTELTADDEEDFLRLPESSDEEDSAVPSFKASGSLPTPEPTQKDADKKRTRPLREVNANGTRASKRLKLNGVEDSESTEPEKRSELVTTQISTASQTSNEPLWLSQSSQSTKRKMQGYKRNKPKMNIPSTPEELPERKETNALDIPDDSSPARTKKENFKLRAVSDVGSSPARSQRPKNSITLLTASPPKAKAASQSLILPTAVGEDDEPTADSLRQELSDGNLQRNRRGSTSSLSSVDSNVDVEVDAPTRARLNSDEDVLDAEVDVNALVCPKCKVSIPLEDCRKMGLDLNIHNQSAIEEQKFCFKHRQMTALNRWRDAGYPQLEFDTLGSSPRVLRHFYELADIVRRKIPSFYLQKLDDAISASKGVKGAVKRYFEIDTLDLIRQGYYGPKSVEVLSRAIAETSVVTKEFKKRARTDRAVQMAGVGRYIDCVLVPELLVRLVMEDNECDDEKARAILVDTQDLGLLLCHDDDHVDEEETQDFD